MGYKPIESYGVIGDMHTVALVGMDGSIDWCCLPHFDSPSVFAAILDERIGGCFRVAATEYVRAKQMYVPDTNVLVTRFLSNHGVGEVTDFMPVLRESGGPTERISHQIVRIARAVRGPMRFRLECFPAFDYARQPHETYLRQRGAVFETPGQSFVLATTQPLTRTDGGVTAEFVLQPNECAVFALRQREGEVNLDMLEEPLDSESLLRETVTYWRNWIGRSNYRGRWREMVNRSALILKLLTFQPTGAIVAAPTCSLPEEVGGVRNWDYRFTWVRDAAFSVYALMRLGYTEETAAFMRFMQARAQEEERVNGPLNVMYGIDGRHDLKEEILTHLEGYRGSKPVRVGNAAALHLQLDIYGELLDSIYLFDKYGSPLSWDVWKQIRRMLDWLSKNWEQPDQSIWEVRGGRQQFTYSKLQCWVAFDRGLRLAEKRSLPLSDGMIRRERDRVYEAIMTEGWSEATQSFRQCFGCDAVDASSLMMPLVLFLSPTDPRMVSTIQRIRQELLSDSLVNRYDVGKAARDGLPGGEGTFSICTFWLVEAMARAGMVDDALFLFEKMLTYANHLGLYGEEIGATSEALGNFPQAFTHLGLISAAFDLDRKLAGKGEE